MKVEIKVKKARKTKAVKPSKGTVVTFLLDRSGSMASCFDATVEAFNGYLDGLRSAPGITFSLYQFDAAGYYSEDILTTTCQNIPIADAPRLGAHNFQPRGSTPLIDAAVRTIRLVEAYVEKRKDRPKVVFCIQTDGAENASRQYNSEYLKNLISQKTEAGWQFNFMGAGIDAYTQARAMGVDAARTMSYNHRDLSATRSAFSASAVNTASFAAGASMNTAYTVAQRGAAQDAYWSELQATVAGAVQQIVPSPLTTAPSPLTTPLKPPRTRTLRTPSEGK